MGINYHSRTLPNILLISSILFFPNKSCYYISQESLKQKDPLPGLILLKMINMCFNGVRSKLRLSHGSQLLH